MSTLLEIAQKYKECDKMGKHCVHYFDIYDHHFTPFRDKPIKLLEIGINSERSLEIWKEYFPNGTIVGVDVDLRNGVNKYLRNRQIIGYKGNAAEEDVINQIIKDHEGFDIIIDDGSHLSWQQKKSFELLFPHVKCGGFYIVEDLFTSYWDEHVQDQQPFIDFCKSIINNINYAAYRVSGWKEKSNKRYTTKPLNFYEKHLANVHFYKGLVIFYKKEEDKLNDEFIIESC